MQLFEIDESGAIAAAPTATDAVQMVVEATLRLYQTRGFVRPWTGYLVYEDGGVVGACGFTSPPREGRVEIAYLSLSGNEGRGLGTAMAARLVEIARDADPELIVFARTLPEENASTTILKKCGFRYVQSFEHSEDDLVWVWERRAGAAPSD